MKPNFVLIGLIVLITLSLLVLGGVFAVRGIFNHMVKWNNYRCGVFRMLSSEQVASFEPKILVYLNSFKSPPRSHVPRHLYDLCKELDDLEFVDRATLYVADPVTTNAMWGFTAWRDYYTNSDGFARFYIVEDFEKAMRKAVDGDYSELEGVNKRSTLTWYKVIKTEGGGKGVVRLDGNIKFDFKKYNMTSEL